MTELDAALDVLSQDITNPRNQSRFYDLFLNTTFYVPTHDPANIEGAAEALNEGDVVPLVVESGGDDYLMIFDTRERMTGWAHAEVPYVEMEGHHLAATSIPPLHWALNAGTDHSKLFLLDEIAWLKQVVEGRAPSACGCGHAEEQ